MNRVWNLLMLCAAAIAISACYASRPEEIKGKEVSTEVFEDYNCSQLANLYRNKQKIAVDMENELKRRADTNEDLYTVWLVTGLQTGGYKYNDGPLADEYAEIKGNMAAIEMIMIDKECSDLPF